MRSFVLSAAAAVALLPVTSSAQEAEPEFTVVDSMAVVGRGNDLTGVATSASEIRVGAEDFRLRPLLREAELLEANPGMIATQHSGDGKSNQLFLRGFNLDHGTDFATWIDGMPVNMPTHGHGHGYTDINFIIPETIGLIEFQKGPYFAESGDFSSAGSARMYLRDDLRGPFARIERGADQYRRAVAGTAVDVGRGSLLVAGSLKGYDGPWDRPQDLRKGSGLATYRVPTSGGDTFRITAMAYDNEWDSSDQIPRRAVDSGLISEFGQIDDTLGGSSSRFSLSAGWERLGANSSWNASAYGIAYDLDLYSNFTYFAADSINGDQIRQVDERTILGGQLTHSRDLGAFGRPHVLQVGVSTRADLISDVGLFRSRERDVVFTVRQDEVTEVTTGAHVGLETRWSHRFRSEIGVRADAFNFDVTALSHPENSGTESDIVVSPKATLAARLNDRLEVYANAGRGFHSNDARGTVITRDPATGDPADAVDPIVQSRGAELGVRFSPARGFRATISAWTLALESELVFVGDAGATEVSDESRRAGIELANFYRISPSLSVDLDVAITRSRFVNVGDDDQIPGALENVVAAGVMWDLPSGVFGALRLRHLGAYPLVEDDSVRADAVNLVNAHLGYRISRVAIGLSVLNLTDSDDADIQYLYESQLAGEPSPVEDVHFHTVEPRQVRLSVSTGL